MSSFHKPKVYRSRTGCCICKAKSSSSRFTGSKKYEDDFIGCFQLEIPRQGEICNACVLLVKRWKNLPPDSDRNWNHVVDSRAGPGMKSMAKLKSKTKARNKKSLYTCEKIEKILKKKKRKLVQIETEREASPALSDRSDELVENGSGESSRNVSPGGSDCEDNIDVGRRLKIKAKRRDTVPEVSGFVDLDFWKLEPVCCGTIFKGPRGEVLIDPRFLKPCEARLAGKCYKTSIQSCSSSSPLDDKPEQTVTKSDNSDSSSDSGYDESSNHSGGDKELNSITCNNGSVSPMQVDASN